MVRRGYLSSLLPGGLASGMPSSRAASVRNCKRSGSRLIVMLKGGVHVNSLTDRDPAAPEAIFGAESSKGCTRSSGGSDNGDRIRSPRGWRSKLAEAAGDVRITRVARVWVDPMEGAGRGGR